MIAVLSCIAYEHDYRALATATIVCLLGSVLSMRLFARTRRTAGARRAVWLLLSGVVCGGTIWTTHFVAMLGYELTVPHAYEPGGTIMSLLLAISASTIGLGIATMTRSGPMIEVGGAVLGFGIAAMHYAGMDALNVGGVKQWDPVLVVASIALGGLFGALAINRVARPVTRFCKWGGAAALVLAIVSMHFTAMGAVLIVPDPSIVVPSRVISDEMLAVSALAVMAIVLAGGLASYLIDAQNQEDAYKRYQHLAIHDPATGLPNRAHLTIMLKDALRKAEINDSRVSVIGIDLDRFKDINDVHGHAMGDLALSTVAERLSTLLSDDEFIARVGGDEFVAVKTNTFTMAQSTAFAATMMKAICEPIDHNGVVLNVGASIGICLFPEDGQTVEELVGRADLAMYRAKQTPDNKICRYDPSMDETMRARAALAMELRHALERGELELYYQPQTDVHTGQFLGYEALLRWNHPIRGLVSPVEFIPIAEDMGLIIPIGEWVLRTACHEAAQWPCGRKIAVNVAPAQIAIADLPKIVHEILLETGLSPARLELEITESSIIGDHQHALHIIRQLKALGVAIAMDDYGTGYSSLSTLQTFPFDKIKIDRSFVSALAASPQASAIIRSTIILANSLNIPVLAEGVETTEHLEFLREQGCHEAQGFLFGRPARVADVRAQMQTLAPRAQAEPTRHAKAHADADALTGHPDVPTDFRKAVNG